MGLPALVTFILNIVSSICALIVLIVFFTIRHYDKKALDRVSIRLQAGIAVLDLIKHSIASFSKEGDASIICSLIGFSTVFMYQAYMLLNICIALNLHLVILLSLKPKKKWEAFYWLGAIGLPALINIPLLASGIFGKSASNFCFIRNGSSFNDYLEIIFVCGLCVLALTYSMIISASVVFKIYKRRFSFQPANHQFTSDFSSKKGYPTFSLKSLALRTCLYPVTFFACYFFDILAMLYYFIYKSPQKVIIILDKWSFSSRGMLHLFAFIADPAVFDFISHIFKPRTANFNSDAADLDCQILAEDYDVSFDFFISSSHDESLPLNIQLAKEFQQYI